MKTWKENFPQNPDKSKYNLMTARKTKNKAY